MDHGLVPHSQWPWTEHPDPASSETQGFQDPHSQPRIPRPWRARLPWLGRVLMIETIGACHQRVNAFWYKFLRSLSCRTYSLCCISWNMSAIVHGSSPSSTSGFACGLSSKQPWTCLSASIIASKRVQQTHLAKFSYEFAKMLLTTPKCHKKTLVVLFHHLGRHSMPPTYPVDAAPFAEALSKNVAVMSGHSWHRPVEICTTPKRADDMWRSWSVSPIATISWYLQLLLLPLVA